MDVCANKLWVKSEAFHEKKYTYLTEVTIYFRGYSLGLQIIFIFTNLPFLLIYSVNPLVYEMEIIIKKAHPYHDGDILSKIFINGIQYDTREQSLKSD